MPEGVLLDTHVWLWFAGGERLAPAARRRIERAAGEDGLMLSDHGFPMLRCCRLPHPLRFSNADHQPVFWNTDSHVHPRGA